MVNYINVPFWRNGSDILDGTRNFEPPSDDEDGALARMRPPRFRPTPGPSPSLSILNPMGESVDVGCGHHTSERMFGPS
ncbi:hypothetical protein AVEN_26554-1 [Araneus ventricosus]|uniref:Uncharacterized protein n=1 Tax=Araneus ventricosus TaxID=182803 RepID=A0A4Y2FSX2_ARAVE|nr:hypothetical protein AVEN_26554-1 [Araneus ventricosus]